MDAVNWVFTVIIYYVGMFFFQRVEFPWKSSLFLGIGAVVVSNILAPCLIISFMSLMLDQNMDDVQLALYKVSLEESDEIGRSQSVTWLYTCCTIQSRDYSYPELCQELSFLALMNIFIWNAGLDWASSYFLLIKLLSYSSESSEKYRNRDTLLFMKQATAFLYKRLVA